MATLNLLDKLIVTFDVSIATDQTVQFDVIIVGGGPAGISAARILAQNKIKCCILEARDRLGGRTHSEYWAENISIDYGAQWVHHIPPNGDHIIFRLAQSDLEMTSLKTDFLQQESTESTRYHRKRLIWDETTKHEIPKKVFKQITHPIGKILHDDVLYNVKIARDVKNKQHSIYDVFKEHYHKAMLQLSQTMEQLISTNINYGVKVDIPFMQRCIDKMICHIESADAMLTQQSLYHYRDDKYKGYDLHMQGKYGEFIHKIGNTLDHKSVDIRLKNVVEQIRYQYEQKTDDFKMKVIAKDCTLGVRREYKAKHVIVCVPVGVLQARKIEFVPRLRASFWKSVDDGFELTNCNKVILYFDGQFAFKNNVTRIDIISKQPLHHATQSLPAEHQKYGGAYRFGVNYKDRKKHNIWVVFITAHCWDENIKQNEMIVKDTIEIFGDIFSDKRVQNGYFPSCKRYHVTRWDVDQYSLGSWPFFKKGGNGKMDCDRIFNANDIYEIESKMKDNNMEKQLQFAGDYTRANGIGTVQTAILSGIRTAQNIL